MRYIALTRYTQTRDIPVSVTQSQPFVSRQCDAECTVYIGSVLSQLCHMCLILFTVYFVVVYGPILSSYLAIHVVCVCVCSQIDVARPKSYSYSIKFTFYTILTPDLCLLLICVYWGVLKLTIICRFLEQLSAVIYRDHAVIYNWRAKNRFQVCAQCSHAVSL